MLRELSWYLESGRFAGLAADLEGSLKRYEDARKEGHEESALSPLREEARLLFEEHCVRSGLREGDNSFINIDAEFFDGDTLNDEAKDEFIKNIVKGHCYQRILWTYMGTTGSMTIISKTEMTKQGFRYEDYLPIEYKKNNPAKKPLADRMGKNEELFYVYSDGTISKEYFPEKTKIQFDRLKGKSGIDFSKGWNPNSSVKKDGWYGAWDHSGTWVKLDGKKGESFTGGKPLTIELIRSGDGAILYDPGMLLLSSPLLMYVTESGEPYGNLELDREKTLDDLRAAVKVMGVSGIGAIGGISAVTPETLEAYKEVLKELAAPSLKEVDHRAVMAAKEAHEAEAEAKTAEKSGLELERKLSVAAMHGGEAAAVLASVVSGTATVPLSPRKKSDAEALGLTAEEAAAVNALPVRPEDKGAYDTILSNLYAAWSYYEGGISKAEVAALVKEYLESQAGVKTAGDTAKVKKESSVINAQTSLGAIIRGEGENARSGVTTYTSGIPGVFSEPASVDFYDEGAKEKYVKSLERKRILPKGGAAAALAALQGMPQVKAEEKAKLNKGLSRALGQYKAIAMSTGMPLAELVEAVKSDAGFGKGTAQTAAMDKKIYYEVAVEDLVTEAKKENLQKKEVRLEEEITTVDEIVIGGVHGLALNEVVFTHKKLMREYGFSAEEVAKAEPFLSSVRLTGDNPVVPVFLAEALMSSTVTNAEDLRQNILSALDTYGGATYNLSTSEGRQAYCQSSRIGVSKITPNDIKALLQTQKPQSMPVSQALYTKLEPKYKTSGDAVVFRRSTPKGTPEKIRFAGVSGKYGETEVSRISGVAFADALLSDEPGTVPGENASDTGITAHNNTPAQITAPQTAMPFTPAQQSGDTVVKTVPLARQPLKSAEEKGGIIAETDFSSEIMPPHNSIKAGGVPPAPVLTAGQEAAIAFPAQQGAGAGIETVPLVRQPLKKGRDFGKNATSTKPDLSFGTTSPQSLIQTAIASDSAPSPAATMAFPAQQSGNVVVKTVPLVRQSLRRLDGKSAAGTKPDFSSETVSPKNQAIAGAFTSPSSSAATIPFPAYEKQRGNTEIAAALKEYSSGSIGEESAVTAVQPDFSSETIPSQSLTSAAGTPAPPSLADVTQSPAQQAKDIELERLRRMEANYAKDKAILEKQKRPILARSETHDIGSAGGTVQRNPHEKKRASKQLHLKFRSELYEQI